MFSRSDATLNTHYLLCGLVSPLVDRDTLVLRLEKSQIDWDEVMAQAYHGMVLARLYTALYEKSLDKYVPDEVREALRGFFELNVQVNTALRHQMHEVTVKLKACDIEHVWLKGATELLSQQWQTSSRTMLDIDIWIPDGAKHRLAFEQLSSLGYESTKPDVAQVLGRGHHYPPLIKEGAPVSLEFHSSLVLPRLSALLPDEGALSGVQWGRWQHERQVSEHTVGVLSRVDQAMQSYVQCAHMSAEQFLSGQVTMMKVHDFVQRVVAIGPDWTDIFESPRFSILQQSPWRKRAKMFFTYLDDAYGLKSPFDRDETYERRLKYPVLASASKFQGFCDRVVACVREGRIGPPQDLPRRVWTNIERIIRAKSV